MAQQAQLVMQLDNISFSYGYWRVITACSLKALSGELVHVTGANGVGKTTLLGLISGLLHPKGGNISLWGPSGEKLCRAGVCEFLAAEGNALFGRLDALENLAFWGRLRGRDTSRETLTRLLGEWGFTRPEIFTGFAVEKFSTGMKRRLALARVVLAEAQIWLLDEPCNGLDQKGRAVFIKALAAHLAKGGTAIVTSHDETIFGDLTARRFDL